MFRYASSRVSACRSLLLLHCWKYTRYLGRRHRQEHDSLQRMNKYTESKAQRRNSERGKEEKYGFEELSALDRWTFEQLNKVFLLFIHVQAGRSPKTTCEEIM
jgi:hypothetical protein